MCNNFDSVCGNGSCDNGCPYGDNIRFGTGDIISGGFAKYENTDKTDMFSVYFDSVFSNSAFAEYEFKFTGQAIIIVNLRCSTVSNITSVGLNILHNDIDCEKGHFTSVRLSDGTVFPIYAMLNCDVKSGEVMKFILSAPAGVRFDKIYLDMIVYYR